MKLEKQLYHSTHNNYIIFDCSQATYEANRYKFAKMLSSNKFDSGLVLLPSEIGERFMVVLEKDGSESAMCGNGVRSVAKYLYDNNFVPKTQKEIVLEIKSGTISIKRIDDDNFRVNMGPVISFEENPNEFVKEDITNSQEIDLKSIDSILKDAKVYHSNLEPHMVIETKATDSQILEVFNKIKKNGFFPHNININFIEIVSDDASVVKNITCERGVDTITQSCGTGSTSVAQYVYEKYGTTELDVKNRGGDLKFEKNSQNEWICTGPAQKLPENYI